MRLKSPIMSLEKKLRSRAQDICELSGAADKLVAYQVPPYEDEEVERAILIDQKLRDQIENPGTEDANDWRCLNDSMWSEVDAVKVVAYRMLHRLKAAGWPAELLDMMYLDEETLAWAKKGLPDENAVVHTDSNGNVLEAGDSVVLIKDLKVKGANFTAKRGTTVRRISLVQDNAGQIEGKVEGQHIVILTEFVKKQLK